jgi:signal transduction histidine kinase/ActR/RegA family two-component response regulator
MWPPQRRVQRPPGWVCFLALSAGIVALHYMLELDSTAQAMAYVAVGIIACAAVVTGILVQRPSSRLHLWFLASGLGLLSVGNTIFAGYDLLGLEIPYPSPADGIYLASHLSFVLAMLYLIRSRQRPSVSDVLDGALVFCDAALLLWFALIETAARDTSVGVLSRVVSSAYPALDVLLIAVLVQLLMAGGVRSASFRMVALGAATLLATDFVYGLQNLDGTYVEGAWLDAGWMIAVSLWGAAALHPSIRTLHLHGRLRETSLTGSRLLLLAAATLVTPLVTVFYLRTEDTFDVSVVVGVAALTTVLVFSRMALLFREHTRAIVALRDAAAQQEVEQALRSSNVRFEAAAKALECAIYEWNADTGETLWTEGLASAFQHPVERTGPRSGWFLEQVHPDDLAEVADVVARAEHGFEGSEASYRFRAGDGTYRYVWDRWIAIEDADGVVSRIIGGLVDVTDRHELELRQQQSQKMEAVGQLAGGIAHDFNNLLLAISGNAELLQESPALGMREQEDVREFVDAAGRAANLTRQLLAYSRPTHDDLGPVDLNSMVTAIQTLLMRLLGENIVIATDLDPRAPTILGTQSRVEQIVVNLAVNARDAMSAGGELRISTKVEPDGAQARLVVEDTGDGMDDATAARAFEPFFTTKEVGIGTGLGLATVYGIVEQAGGTITLASRAGQGTRVDVLLPVAERRPEVVMPAAPVVSSGSELILLVEDEHSVRAVVTKMLTAHGYAVVAADNPIDALERLAEEAFVPDLIVSDLVMPGLSGVELAERVASLRPGLRVLFISGYSGHSMLEDNCLVEEVQLVEKPFTAAALTQAVRQMLDHHTVLAGGR